MGKSKNVNQSERTRSEKEETNNGYVVEISCQEIESKSIVKSENNAHNMQNNIEQLPVKSVLTGKDNFNLKVFVGNLGEDVTAVDVKKLFTKDTGIQENDVLDMTMLWKVKKDEKTLVFTFVQFASEEAFQAALTLNNTLHCGQSILVLPSVDAHYGLFCMEKGEPECKKEEKVTEVIETEAPSDVTYIPVYKKSDHVAYLRNLPPYVTEEDILQFFSLTLNDVVDIAVLRHSRARKSSAKRRPVRAVIAFSCEEDLKKCLAQTNKMFKNFSVIVERHEMTKRACVGEKRSSAPSAVNDNTKTLSSPKRQTLDTASETELDSKGKMELDLFVKHINWNVSDHVVQDFFASVGAKVQGMKQFGEHGTKFRGMGFVTMADKESLLRGLALDGTVLFGNKIKVSIRNDRTFLVCPIEGEIPHNYSTFVGNLPIKKNADSLKLALTEYLKGAGCSVKSLYVPLADNHSGNRGYAFIMFDDENSLTKTLGFNNSEIEFCGCKMKITVSKHWPENKKETSDMIIKTKEPEYKSGNCNVDPESSKSGRQHKRKRKGPLSPHSGSVYKNHRENPKKFIMQRSNVTEYPLKQQQHVSNYNSYDSDYNAYLDYLEFRDYVAMRKTYDEQQVIAEYHARNQSGSGTEFQQQQKTTQPYLPPATSSFGTNITKAFQEAITKPKEGSRETEWKTCSSYIPPGSSDGIGYDHLQQASALPTNSYEKLAQNLIPASSHGYEKNSQTSIPISTSISREKQDSHHTLPHPSKMDARDLSSSVWTPGNRYKNSNNISLQPASQWYGSSNQSCWKRRESQTLRQTSLNSNNSSNRGRGDGVYTSHSSLPGPPLLSDLRSSGLHTGRTEHDRLYSGTDRRASYSTGTVQNSSTSYPIAAEAIDWHSYQTGSSACSRTNELYSYADY